MVVRVGILKMGDRKDFKMCFFKKKKKTKIFIVLEILRQRPFHVKEHG